MASTVPPSNIIETGVCSQPLIPSGAIGGLSVEGVILALTLIALTYMDWRTKNQAQEIDRLTQANNMLDEKRLEPQSNVYQQWMMQPGHGATEMPQYGHGNPLESTEGRQELGQAVPKLSESPMFEAAAKTRFTNHYVPRRSGL